MMTGELNRMVRGAFANWRKGTKVKIVERNGDGTCTVERLNKKRGGHAIENQMAAVPEAAIDTK